MGGLMVLNQNRLKQGLVFGSLGLILVLVCVFLVWHNKSSLVVVDMTRAIQKPSMMLARSKLTTEAQLKIMRRFSALLPEVIKAYGESHRVTVVSATVLAHYNTDDITDRVVEQTITRMKHED